MSHGYREVDQGRNVEPKLESTVKPEDATKKGKGKKGKNDNKGKKKVFRL